MTERKYRKGDILFKRDDAAHEMLLTVTGKDSWSRKSASSFRRDA